MELVEDVNNLFQRDWEGIIQRLGGGVLVVTNEMVNREKFFVYL